MLACRQRFGDDGVVQPAPCVWAEGGHVGQHGLQGTAQHGGGGGGASDMT